jgi:TatD DNase family protein
MNPSFFTDSHAHLTHEGLVEEVDALLQRAQESNVKAIVNICTDLPSLEKGLALSRRYPWVYQTAATTPHDVEKEGEEVFGPIALEARRGSLVAIGETGLDYFYQHSDRAIQKDFLRRYLHLALECHLPVVIHCREAFVDFFEILDAEYQINNKHAPGVLHCFTGTIAEAEEVLKRGWMLSLSGIVTFKKSIELQEVAKMVPLNQLLIETDSPYLAPQKHRGKTNEPAFVVETATFIANLKGIPVEELARQTSLNAQHLFKLQALA